VARVLVVDDEEIVRIVLTAFLQKMRHDAVVVQNGVDALDSLRRRPVDLVITDIYMPDMDGLELIRKINALKPRPPIIAVSGAPSARRMDVLRTAEQFGASGFLYKPLDFDALSALVARLLNGAAG